MVVVTVTAGGGATEVACWKGPAGDDVDVVFISG